MWHETKDEMIEFLKSIIRLDEDQCARRVAQKYLRVVDPGECFKDNRHLTYNWHINSSREKKKNNNLFMVTLSVSLPQIIMNSRVSFSCAALDNSIVRRSPFQSMHSAFVCWFFSAHIFFDDAFELSDNDVDIQVNSFVRLLVATIDDAASDVHQTTIRVRPPKKYPAPYGGRLVWPFWDFPFESSLIHEFLDLNSVGLDIARQNQNDCTFERQRSNQTSKALVASDVHVLFVGTSSHGATDFCWAQRGCCWKHVPIDIGWWHWFPTECCHAAGRFDEKE